MTRRKKEKTAQEAGKEILEILESLEHDLENMRQLRQEAMQPGTAESSKFDPEVLEILTSPEMSKAIMTSEKSKEAFSEIRKMAEILINTPNPT